LKKLKFILKFELFDLDPTITDAPNTWKSCQLKIKFRSLDTTEKGKKIHTNLQKEEKNKRQELG